MKQSITFLLFFALSIANHSIAAPGSYCQVDFRSWTSSGADGGISKGFSAADACSRGCAATGALNECSIDGNGKCQFKHGSSQNFSTTTPQCHTCPGGQVWDNPSRSCTTCVLPEVYNPDTHSCEIPVPPCEQEINPYTGECETCTSQRYAPEDNPTLGHTYGQCLPDPTGCLSSGGTAAYDASYTTLGPGGGDHITECIPSSGPCSNITGKIGNNDSLLNFDYCQEKANECTATGGTYGAIGVGNSAYHVCLQDADDLPTCASGSAYWIENLDGGSAFSCIPTDPPVDVCDGQKYDCDGDGNIDDQDHDGCVDNGTLNDFEACTPRWGPDGTGEGGGGPERPGEGETNTGVDPLKPAVEGAGDCDPTSQNYAECSGGLSEETTAGIEKLVNSLNNDTTSIGDKFDEQSIADSTEGYYSSLSSVPIIVAVNNISGAFSGAGTCPAPSFSAFGEDFDIDLHCTLYDSISGVLSAAMFVFWTILGIRHFMSA